MRHYIIGTAGHIDHGKTALVKALTNIDCDTHPEEKRRGITINPGFAYLRQSDSSTLAFVDVPGHQRFIHNMIAGATGVDFLMLVVAADDGVMPQTIEHLKICSLLGIKSGITVINKCDNVSPDFLELCKEEVAHFLRGTFLEHKPIFCVSATKGTGIDALRDYLLQDDFEVVPKERQHFFRMYIDRLFHVSGFGYIATGTSLGSGISVGDSAVVLPKKRKVKVRNIQRHGEGIISCVQGNRVALDLAGVKREEVEVGDLITKREPHETQRIDAKLTFLDKEYGRLASFEALLFVGTRKIPVKVRMITCMEKEAVAQIALGCAWYFSLNERFILRNTSNDQTIAGGVVIDPLPLVHKKMTPQFIDALLPTIGVPLAYVLYKTNESIHLLDTHYFSRILQWEEEHIFEEIRNSSELFSIFHNNTHIVFSKKKFSDFAQTITNSITEYHTQHPFSPPGLSKGQLRSATHEQLPYKDHQSREVAFQLFLSQMEREGTLSQSNRRWNMTGYKPEITQIQQESLNFAETLILDGGLEGVYEDELLEKYKTKTPHPEWFHPIINRLTETKTIYRSQNKLFHAIRVTQAKRMIYKYLTAHEEGIKVTQFREVLGTNRTIAMTYLDILESEQFIIREGDVRVLVKT